MNRLLTLAVVLVTTCPSFSQEFQAMRPTHELSLNAQGIVGSIGPFGFFSDNAYDSFQPLIRYRYYLGDHALRIGLEGGRSQDSMEASDSTFRESVDQSFSVFLGYEYTFTQFGRLHAYTGVDMIYGKRESESRGRTLNDREFDYRNDQTNTSGKLFVGLRFFLSPRVSLATEMGALATQSRQIQINTRSWDVPETTESTVSRFSTSYSFPRIIYVDIRL